MGSVLDLVLTGACWAAAMVLIALKLVGAVDWAWWWIVGPLWLPFAIASVALGGLAMLERFR